MTAPYRREAYVITKTQSNKVLDLLDEARLELTSTAGKIATLYEADRVQIERAKRLSERIASFLYDDSRRPT